MCMPFEDFLGGLFSFFFVENKNVMGDNRWRENVEHKRLYRKMHLMKKTIIRKIIYVFVCLFLLCNFFCLDKDGITEADAFSYNDSPSITIHVPNGVQMEIKSEKSSSAVVASTIAKAVQLKTFSSFRYFL